MQPIPPLDESADRSSPLLPFADDETRNVTFTLRLKCSLVLEQTTKKPVTVKEPAIENTQVIACKSCSRVFVKGTTTTLECGHHFCRICLRERFKGAARSWLLPVCCAKKPIPVRLVDKLFGPPFKKLWNSYFSVSDDDFSGMFDDGDYKVSDDRNPQSPRTSSPSISYVEDDGITQYSPRPPKRPWRTEALTCPSRPQQHRNARHPSGEKRRAVIFEPKTSN
ncbi:hypothetical protein B0J13DRAFT_301495 [Dactylonectria estremocensis]|uniref:RING-type domain-containing protein n=1 Tax=Dactylonectria estremocensis TaxID=1079267 RepID=A0A9P9EZW0_9HYPO|nr:hypothetical protein B0J13DRAFT_301495 [Dactylonectria estremocensis]